MEKNNTNANGNAEPQKVVRHITRIGVETINTVTGEKGLVAVRTPAPNVYDRRNLTQAELHAIALLCNSWEDVKGILLDYKVLARDWMEDHKRENHKDTFEAMEGAVKKVNELFKGIENTTGRKDLRVFHANEEFLK